MNHRNLLASLVVCCLLAPGVAMGAELKARIAASGSEAGPAVVWLEGLSGEVPSRDTVISHRPGGDFEPLVTIGFVGNEFILRNEDDTLHNIHLYLALAYQKKASSRPLDHGATLYNIALPIEGMEVRRPIKPYHRYREDTGFITVVCNPHPGEEAFVLVFDHPYAAVAGDDGTVLIPDVPTGRHEMRIWQGGTVRTQSVEVKDGAPTEVVVEMTAP